MNQAISNHSDIYFQNLLASMLLTIDPIFGLFATEVIFILASVVSYQSSLTSLNNLIFY